MKKVLNLFAGGGGNRKDWEDVEVTAVENDPEIGDLYKQLHPNDTVVVADAFQYFEDNYSKYDFIWLSPPCPTHSQFRFNINVRRGQSKPVMPDMRLYGLIVFLQYNAKCLWIVENVKPYYEPLIEPSLFMERHLWWCNFPLPHKNFDRHDVNLIKRGTVKDLEEIHGINLSGFEVKNKRRILRNCVSPRVGKYILEMAKLSYLNKTYSQNLWRLNGRLF